MSTTNLDLIVETYGADIVYPLEDLIEDISIEYVVPKEKVEQKLCEIYDRVEQSWATLPTDIRYYQVLARTKMYYAIYHKRK